MKMRRPPMWVTHWNEDKTEGVIVRVRNWPDSPYRKYPPAPCVEGKIRRAVSLTQEEDGAREK